MRVLILGASARSAAASARRAGLEPTAIDLFADRDLRALGTALRAEPERYPRDLERISAGIGVGPWIYTGAMENHPELVDRIAAVRPLWGNAGEGLRACRDPFALAETLARAGLPHAAAWRSAIGLPRDGSVLVKPIASAGGRGIEPLTERTTPRVEAVYYQERLRGTSLGAVFLAARGRADLVGVTEHWTGPGFAWRGNLGPRPLSVRARSGIERIGNAVASAFGLVGLVGVDLILSGDVAVPVEINPRYTASVEVLELATGRALLEEHRRACEGTLGPILSARGGRPVAVGKVVLFAEAHAHAPVLEGWQPVVDLWEVPQLADIPTPGTRFRPGEPVLTLLQAAASLEECRAALRRRLRTWEHRLRGREWTAPIEDEEQTTWTGS